MSAETVVFVPDAHATPFSECDLSPDSNPSEKSIGNDPHWFPDWPALPPPLPLVPAAPPLAPPAPAPDDPPEPATFPDPPDPPEPPVAPPFPPPPVDAPPVPPVLVAPPFELESFVSDDPSQPLRA